jgi:hypothetical protein
MEKQIRVVDKENKIVQITTVDERWYSKEIPDPVTGIPTHLFVPSSTWICSYYPKGIAYHQWIAQKGWDKAEEIKNAAGDKGSKVHFGLEMIFDGKKLLMNDRLPSPQTGNQEEITLEEWECLMSAVRWAEARQPQSVQGEFNVFNDKDGYAGTVDRIFVIDGKPYIVDFKTSKNIWPEHRLQLSSYKHALIEMGMPGAKDLGMMILQVGYKLNRLGYKETEIEDKFDTFLAVKKIWADENSNEKPKQRDYPLALEYKPKPKVEAIPSTKAK